MRSTLFAAALACATTACRPATEPTAPPDADAAPPAEAPLPPGVAEALAPRTAIPAAPAASAPIPFVLRPAAAPPSGEPPLGPGEWSPDGRHLLAYTRESSAAGAAAVGRVWIVDAHAIATDVEPAVSPAGAGVPPAPAWVVDSGDVVGVVGAAEQPLATWRKDGSLLLAREADRVIDAEGTVRPTPTDGLDLGPDLPEHLENVLTKALAGLPADVRLGSPADAWVGRIDGDLAATVSGSGSVWVVDAADGSAREIIRLVFHIDDADDSVAGEPTSDVGDVGDIGDALDNADDTARADRAPIRPIWLADGRLFVPRPARIGAETASPVVDYPLIDPETLAIEPATVWAGLPANPATPPDGRAFVAPNRLMVLVPRVVVDPGGPALAGTRLAHVDGTPPTDIQPIGSPLWAPDSSAIAYPEAGTLFVYDIASGQTRRLFDGGTRDVWWSPDSRRLAVATVDGGLVLVQRDGTLAPTPVLGDFDGTLPPSWSDGGERIAVTSHGAEGPPKLVVIDLSIELPTP